MDILTLILIIILIALFLQAAGGGRLGLPTGNFLYVIIAIVFIILVIRAI